MTTGVVSPHDVSAAAICWGQGPHAFELRSADSRVLSRADVVFRPWTTAAASAAPTRSWTVLPQAGVAGSWTLRRGGADDVMVPAEPAAAVRYAEFLAVQAILDSPPDVLTLHAALVARDGHGVLIAGLPEAGKSTLACALWQSGFSLLGDDVAIVDAETGRAAPAPRRVSLRRSSRALLGEDLWTRIHAAPATDVTAEGCVFHPDEVEGARPSSTTLAAIVFLARTGAAPMRELARPIPGAHAALALLPYSNLIRRIDAGTLISRLAPLAASTPAYDLRRAALPEMVAAVGALIGRRP